MDVVARKEQSYCHFVALNIPSGSVISLDGVPVVLKREDFVGFSGLPMQDAQLFHLVTVRAAAISVKPSSMGTCGNPSATTAGFVAMKPESLYRRFDPKTEEVAPQPLDKDDANRLQMQIAYRQVPSEQLVPYGSFVTENLRDAWNKLTSYITSAVLMRHGIKHGHKLVPGSPTEDEGDHEMSGAIRAVDGMSPAYPAIPIVSNNGGFRLVRHAGTRRFMSTLSSAERTRLFVDPSPANRALDLVLNLQFQGSWDDLLGDVQLSFVLFLHLQCFSSLSYWCDVLAMLSMVDEYLTEKWCSLYAVLSSQLLSVDDDMFDSGLLAESSIRESFERLASKPNKHAKAFHQLLNDRFPCSFQDEYNPPRCGEDSDDDMPPTVVPNDEVLSALSRNSEKRKIGHEIAHPATLCQRFPILFAAIQPGEDVLMTCARAIDDAQDVSLVREAAAYLENVELNA